jgi:hypothetical protein
MLDDEKEEYRIIWQYIMHAENVQFRLAQWYATITAATLGFIYSDYFADPEKAEDRWIVLTFVFIYSITVIIRSLMIKQNYEKYRLRAEFLIKSFKEKSEDIEARKFRPFAVYNLHYYGLSIISAFLAFLLTWEFKLDTVWLISLPIVYLFIMIAILKHVFLQREYSRAHQLNGYLKG